MEAGKMLEVWADGVRVGVFKWSQRKRYKSWFNLCGVVIKDVETGMVVSRSRLDAEYKEAMKRGGK